MKKGYSGGESIHHMSCEQLLLRDCFPLGKKKPTHSKSFLALFSFSFTSILYLLFQLKIVGNLQYPKKKKMASARSWGTLGFKGLALEKTKEKLEYS